jgi:hypothetical protein
MTNFERERERERESNDKLNLWSVTNLANFILKSIRYETILAT